MIGYIKDTEKYTNNVMNTCDLQCINDVVLVRNAGNLVPHSTLQSPSITSTEPAALELGCVLNNIKHVVVCGHSDCKVNFPKFKIHHISFQVI